MKVTGRYVLVGVPAFVVVLLLAIWALSYHSSEFKGGLDIRDSGYFSYPRYHAELGDLPLWTNGDYKFVVRGLPPDPLDLVLEVVDATDADRTELTSLATSVSVSVTDNSGKELCRATGNLSDARTRAHASWVLASSISSATFWHPVCQNLAISRSKAYTIKVVVSGVNNRSPHKMLMAVLQGGGNELP